MEATQAISYPDESVLLSPEKAWELFNEADFRITPSRVPFEPNLILCDVKVGKKLSEDKLYETNPSYLYNLRRGLSFLISADKCDKTLLASLSEEQKDPSKPAEHKSLFMIARKGLHKFFDLTPEYLDDPFPLPNKDNKANYIFWSVGQCLSKGGEVEVFSTRKANGENAQVSYLGALGVWCIASKNVALCIRDVKDLSLYTTDRYKFSIEIANAWLKKAEDLKAKGRLEEFQKSIDRKTLIGEYVGNANHQHLIAYGKETIVFYAIVDNNSPINCADPEQALQFFKNYELDHVSYNSVGVFSSLKDLRSSLLNSYIDTSKQSLYNEEEGIVLYLAKRGTQSFTFSSCKVKTLEYRLYRKLREHLRRQVAKSLCSFICIPSRREYLLPF
eukprot:TRINITY_DN6460_c0_g2_i1.p1 TRINITY_DN6460_c0_g2~~TRINITY_DN6460_c0_g2_i1.p1  ORF type:complete len:389 (+),score=67.02 TRINITY_DN6460_c0_g2_i1:165-1331(+)